MIIDILNQIKKEEKIGIREIGSHNIIFEEKGVIRPGKWGIISRSKPIFRTLIEVNLASVREAV
jgi:hypothetical protein